MLYNMSGEFFQVNERQFESLRRDVVFNARNFVSLPNEKSYACSLFFAELCSREYAEKNIGKSKVPFLVGKKRCNLDRSAIAVLMDKK